MRNCAIIHPLHLELETAEEIEAEEADPSASLLEALAAALLDGPFEHPELLWQQRHFVRFQWYFMGGFKFQVQRVNEGAVAHRLPGAWRN